MTLPKTKHKKEKVVTKIYVQYSYPDPDNAAIIEVWCDGEKPKKMLAKNGCVFISDCTGKKDKRGFEKTENCRVWDGEE